jgi:hypothetical protein
MTEPCVDLLCEYAVIRGLDLAARRSPATGRHNGARKLGTATAYLTHTRIRLAANDSDCDKLLRGAWDLLIPVLPEHLAGRIVTAIDTYTRQLILTQSPPTADTLRPYIEVACEPAT